MNEEQSLHSSTALIDALNEVVLSVEGITELYPPQSVLSSAADQLVAFVSGKDAPPVRTVAVEEKGDGLRIIARVGVSVDRRTPEVISRVASAIRRHIATDINPDVQCTMSIQAVSIQ